MRSSKSSGLSVKICRVGKGEAGGDGGAGWHSPFPELDPEIQLYFLH